MKPEFMCCSTPIPPHSLIANNTNNTGSKQNAVNAQSTDSELKEGEEDYVMTEDHYQKCSFPFKGRAEIASQILRKVTAMRRANSQSFSTNTKVNQQSTNCECWVLILIMIYR